MLIEDNTQVEYAAARESEMDPGYLAVYRYGWTTERGLAETVVIEANKNVPIAAPGKPWAVWTRTVTTTNIRKVTG